MSLNENDIIPSIIDLLNYRKFIPYDFNILIENKLEDNFIYSEGNFAKKNIQSLSEVQSTIAIAISNDNSTIASSHGDHTIKIFTVNTLKLMHEFKGHPRTPWCLKYNPQNSNILVSGCLGHQIRVWNITTGNCDGVLNLSDSIISLSFNFSGEILAISHGKNISFWNFKDNYTSRPTFREVVEHVGEIERTDTIIDGLSEINHIVHDRNIRSVLFIDNNNLLIAAPLQTNSPLNFENDSDSELIFSSLFSVNLNDLKCPINEQLTKIKLSTLPIIISKIHLYSEGGLDISSDGKYLITCARLWDSDRNDIINSSKGEYSSPSSIPNYDILSTEPLQYESSYNFNMEASMSSLNLDDETKEKTFKKKANRKEKKKNKIENYNLTNNIFNILTKSQLNKNILPTFNKSKKLISLLTSTLEGQTSTKGNYLVIFELKVGQNNKIKAQAINARPISVSLLKAITSIKFSPTHRYALLGYGVRISSRMQNFDIQTSCEIIHTTQELLPSSAIINDVQDEVNIARFLNVPGTGIIYGTRKGKLVSVSKD